MQTRHFPVSIQEDSRDSRRRGWGSRKSSTSRERDIEWGNESTFTNWTSAGRMCGGEWTTPEGLQRRRRPTLFIVWSRLLLNINCRPTIDSCAGKSPVHPSTRPCPLSPIHFNSGAEVLLPFIHSGDLQYSPISKLDDRAQVRAEQLANFPIAIGSFVCHSGT